MKKHKTFFVFLSILIALELNSCMPYRYMPPKNILLGFDSSKNLILDLGYSSGERARIGYTPIDHLAIIFGGNIYKSTIVSRIKNPEEFSKGKSLELNLGYYNKLNERIGIELIAGYERQANYFQINHYLTSIYGTTNNPEIFKANYNSYSIQPTFYTDLEDLKLFFACKMMFNNSITNHYLTFEPSPFSNDILFYPSISIISSDYRTPIEISFSSLVSTHGENLWSTYPTASINILFHFDAQKILSSNKN